MDIQLKITGGDRADELAALWHWLQEEDEFRGDVSPVETRAGDGELGGAVDLFTVVLGSGGAGVALTRALSTWLQTRYSDVKVTVSSGTRSVEVEASRVKDAAALLQEVLRDLDSP